jgi:hypothetical protein
MRKFALLGVTAGLMALSVPATALAAQPPPTNYGTNCDYAKSPPQTVSHGTNDIPAPVGPDPGGNQVYVYSGTGSTGDPGTIAVGVCGNVPAGAGTFQGGTAEVGTNATKGTYAVIDGNNGNNGQGQGYAGLSNYEDTGPDPTPCNGNDNDSPQSTNGGGCFGLKPTGTNVPLPTTIPTPICGDTSGNNWNSTKRDGCFIP